MKSKSCSFAIGLGLGSLLGVLAYRYSRTPGARRWKRKVSETYRKINVHAGELMDTAREKALDAGTKVADKVSGVASDVAGRAEEAKSGIQAYMSES